MKDAALASFLRSDWEATQGLPMNRTRSKDGPDFQLAVFDDRRGNREGNQDEKLLAFYPAGTPVHEQESAVGLIQALIAFTQVFGTVGTAYAPATPF
jgi:First Longin domain of INTU, CCZ1 and HPS4